MAVTADWQCNRSLTECLEHMFTTHTASDVTFLLGEDRQVVHAHKFILISRSPVFYAMFEGPMSEKGEITVPDIQTHTFVDFLGYLYTDRISLAVENVMYIMYAAKKYCVDCLTEECRDYLKTNLNVKNACNFLEHAHLCSEEMISTDCLSIISKNPKQCLQSQAFTELCQSCVCRITDSDDLAVTEDVVFEAVMRWSEAECGRQDLEVTDANRREVLGDALYTVRYTLMNIEYFCKEVIKNNVLQSEDVVLVLKLKYEHEITAPSKIKVKVRKQTQFNRFQRLSCSTNSWNQNGMPDAISFQLSNESYFHGVGMYGCREGRADYDVRLQLFDATDVILRSTTKKIITDQTQDIYDVKFDSPIELEAGTFYTVVATMTGRNAKQGGGGKQTVQDDLMKITFLKSSKKSSNGTDVNIGQIPCILLS